ncbi:MAG TPA: hypothetical protein PK995_07295 [Bacteroidia bacterium]|nr:hypothetical protein [Bacteroidia bacterium]
MNSSFKIKILLILLIGWQCYVSNAQVNKLLEAFECYKNKDLTCAKSKIDSVIIHPETKDEPGAWTIRASVYYQYYRNYELRLFNSPYRNEAIKSIEKSRSLSPDAEMETQNKQVMLAIAQSYYNQIKYYLYDSLNYEICLQLYNNYKKYYQEIYPGTDFKEKDIEFYLSVGGEFVTRAKKELESSKSEVLPDVFNKYIDIAKITFSKVLDLDPNNISALKGLAFAYYNLGAKLIKDMSYDISIEETFQIQENAAKYFKQALPYMQKAFELNKDDEKVIEGLTGIYEALHDHDKYIEFKKKLDQIKKDQQK